MRLFQRKATGATSPRPVERAGLWRTILEPFTGAWQRNITESVSDVDSYPTLYACLMRISSDIGKLPFQVMRKEGTLYSSDDKQVDVLIHPNNYQTPQQFREAWEISKLSFGNAYVLKERDERGKLMACHVLDPTCVQVLISPAQNVFYKITPRNPDLIPFTGEVILPATEIMHDRINCLYHPLIGISPVAAANMAAIKNLRILNSQAELFQNGMQLGGLLTVPAGTSKEDLTALREYWKNTKPTDVRAIGMDAKFSPFAVKSVDAQLVEQMRYSDEQICQPFGIPPFILGIGGIPAGLKVEDVVSVYYRFALHAHVEAMETLITAATDLGPNLVVKQDTSQLLRMDDAQRAQVIGTLRQRGVFTPNEGRAEFNKPPLEGGDTVYLQAQDYPLDQVRQNVIPVKAAPSAPARDDTEDAIKALSEELSREH